MEEFINMISKVGFPVGVAVYLLVERNTSLKAYTETMQRLVTKIEVLIEIEKGGSK